MRGTVKSELTGRDLNRYVTLRLPTVGLQRTDRGVLIPGGETVTWAEHRVRAMRMESKGKESVDGKLLADTRACRWIIAYRRGLTTRAEIRDEEGTVWNIRGLEEIGKRSFWGLECTARPETSNG